MTQILLLGPQRTRPTLARALKLIDDSNPLAVITAGWQEREGELDDLARHLSDKELLDLRLYERSETVIVEDPELDDALRERQNWLKELQRLYRLRLRHALQATTVLDRREGIVELIESERADALAALRDLDRHHLRKIRQIQFDYWKKWKTAGRPAVARQREELAAILKRCNTLLIAGGNIGVLLNRIRLFDLGPLLGRMNLVGWSAGAMALSERVVLFHDHSPQGLRDAEVLDVGLGAYRGLIVFPDARRRLALDDPRRTALLSERLKPAASVALDEESIVVSDGRNWRAESAAPLLSSIDSGEYSAP